MSKKSIDSSPISHLQDIFNVKQENIKSQSLDISLMTEINDQKVIMDFHWIKDLNVLISSFSIDNYEFSFLTNHINKINNNLVIGTLKQNTNNTINIVVAGCFSDNLYGSHTYIRAIISKPMLKTIAVNQNLFSSLFIRCLICSIF